MGRHQYAKDVRVTVNEQGGRKSYYNDHDNRDSSSHSHRGGSTNRVWRRGEGGNKRVSFQKRGVGKIGRGGHKKFDSNRLGAALREYDDDMGGPSIRGGRARPATRAIRGKFRGTVGGMERNRFVKITPLSDDNKKIIKEAMSERYNVANRALDLSNFGADAKFGGSSGAIGKLTDPRVVEAVLEIIGENLRDLNALNLSNNQLRYLRTYDKLADKAPNIEILYLEKNLMDKTRELDYFSRLKLLQLKLDGNPFLRNFTDGANYRRYSCCMAST